MILIDILTNLEYGEEAPYFKLFGVDIRCLLIRRKGYKYKSFKLYKKTSDRLHYLYACSFTPDEIAIDTFDSQEELGRYEITELKEDPTYFVLRDNFLREDVSISG